VRRGSRELVTTQEKLDRMSNYSGNDRWKKRTGGLAIYLSRSRVFRQETCIKINLGLSRPKGIGVGDRGLTYHVSTGYPSKISPMPKVIGDRLSEIVPSHSFLVGYRP
jgi:hypothetical protein